MAGMAVLVRRVTRLHSIFLLIWEGALLLEVIHGNRTISWNIKNSLLRKSSTSFQISAAEAAAMRNIMYGG
eukprot:10703239-Ditylum_brightwellii.AAC.1